jgi:transcriptional regulator with GAF, ATPase, and Fis domain
MANKLNAKNSTANYPGKFKTAADNEQIESIKSITNLLLRKIEALEKELPEAATEPFKKGSNLYDVISSFEKKLIRDALRATNWSQRRAAQILGVKVTTLNAKMKRYEMNVKSLSGFSTGQTNRK